ncbi:MAG: hypothetical protein WCG85_02340 [Polyangia bacterium]
MPLNTLNDDLDQASKQTQALLEQSTRSTQEVQTALQPVRVAISAIQNQQTSQFNAIASQSDAAKPPLGQAIESAQRARTVDFNRIAEAGNRAVGLPATIPTAPVPEIRPTPGPHIIAG